MSSLLSRYSFRASDHACKLCNNLTAIYPTKALEFDIELSSLRRPKQSKCRYCEFLLTVFDYYNEAAINSRKIRLKVGKNQPIIMGFDGFGTAYELWYFLYRPRGISITALPNIGEAEEAGTSLDSETCFQFIRERLSECAEETLAPDHCDCAKFQYESSMLPKRVLDVSAGKVRLRTTLLNGQPISGRYCALSYQWGPAHLNLQTTNANLQERMENIDWASLPQVHRDAITVTRQLNLDFLWIDSLCIIQDSGEDWAREANEMASYYGEAYVTLIVTASENATVPFLRPRDIKDLQENRSTFSIRNDDESTSQIIGRKVPDHAGVQLTSHLPISKRAWTYQENVLSSRAVHFTPGEIIWECRSCLAFENGAKLRSNLGLSGRIRAFDSSAKPDVQRTRSYMWKMLVTEYSRRQLSYEEDRMLAIAGIVQRISLNHNSEYLNGIWMHWLPSELLWYSEAYLTPEKSHSYYKATAGLPSWSWMSVTGSVSYFFQYLENGVRLEEVKVIPPDLGSDRNGPMELQGLAFDTTLSCKYDGGICRAYMTIDPKSNQIRPRVYVDTLIRQRSFEDDHGAIHTTAARVHEGEEAPTDGFNAQVKILYIGGGRYFSQNSRRGTIRTKLLALTEERYFYLILVPSEQDGGGFQRIGAFEASERPPKTAGNARITLW